MMDWFNTNFYRDYAYGFIYPQMFPHHKRQGDEVQAAHHRVGREERARTGSKMLDEHLARAEQAVPVRRRDHHRRLFRRLPGDARRGRALRLLSRTRTSTRWLDNMKKLKSWPKVNEVFYGSSTPVKDSRSQRSSSALGRRHDQGPAPQRLSLPRLGGDAEVLRGLPRPAARAHAARSARPRAGARPTRCTPSTGWTTVRTSRSSRRPTGRSSSSRSTTSTCTSRSRSSRGRSRRCWRRASRRASRRAASPITSFIDSIYFRDPNGYVIELTAKRPESRRGDGSDAERRAQQAQLLSGLKTARQGKLGSPWQKAGMTIASDGGKEPPLYNSSSRA